jgi:hypothetical protein
MLVPDVWDHAENTSLIGFEDMMPLSSARLGRQMFQEHVSLWDLEVR